MPWILLIISMLLYFGSLALPAFSCGVDGRPDGMEVLVFGWLGPIVGDPRWYANALWVVVLVLMLRGKAVLARNLSLFAVLIAISSAVFPITFYHGEDGGHPVEHLLVGAWLWIGAILVQSCAAFALEWQRRSE